MRFKIYIFLLFLMFNDLKAKYSINDEFLEV